MPIYSSYNALGTSIETAEIGDDQVTTAKILDANVVIDDKLDVVPGGGDLLFIPSAMSVTVDAGTWSYHSDANMVHHGGWKNDNRTQNDAFSFDAYIPKGTYTIHILAYDDTDRGIVTVKLDTVSQGTFDFYAGATAYNQWLSDASNAVATSGIKTIQCIMATKHASASNYGTCIVAIWFERTA